MGGEILIFLSTNRMTVEVTLQAYFHGEYSVVKILKFVAMVPEIQDYGSFLLGYALINTPEHSSWYIIIGTGT